MTYVRAWHVSLLRHEVDCGSDGEVATLIEKTKSSNARNASILIKESVPCLYPESARIRRASRNWVHSSSQLWYISLSMTSSLWTRFTRSINANLLQIIREWII